MKKKELEKASEIYERYASGILPESQEEKKLLERFLQFMSI